MIQKTQDDWNCGHHATDRQHHVPLPDSVKIAKAYGIKTFDIYENSEIKNVISEVLALKEAAFCAVHIPIEKKISIRAKGGRLDNLFPFLPEELVRQEMSN